MRRAPGFSDRKQTEALGRRIVDLVSLKVGGQTLPPDVTKWIEDISPQIRKMLGRIGLLDAGKVAALRLLSEHLDGATDAPGWKQHLESKGNTAAHVVKSCGMVRRILVACKFSFWSDISASRMLAYLGELRQDKADGKGGAKRGSSSQTSNYYLGAFKSFCKWMVADGRATVSPVAYLTGLNAKTDRRLVRRALSVEELRWLLETTKTGAESYGMAGPARAMLYKLAVETGLRSNELRTMTRASFNLDGDNPTVAVAAAYSKHRREDVLPLRADTAADLRAFLSAKMPGAAAFAIPHDRHESAAMFTQDLAAARVAWLADAPTPQDRQAREKTGFLLSPDHSGLVVDFHGLRHTCGSLLAAAQVHPKVAQSIMRHSTIELTMSRYSHVYAGQEVAAVAALPDLGESPARESARATGTDNVKAAPDAVGCPTNKDRSHDRADVLAQGQETRDSVLAFCLAQKGGINEHSLEFTRGSASGREIDETPCEIVGSPVLSGVKSALAGVAELADAQDSKS